MVDSTWAHQQRREGGWAAFDSEKPRATNWLASIIGAKEELPSHIDQKPSADDVAHRLKGIKRSFLRRLPSTESIWPQRRGPRLTDQGRSSVSIPSATTVRFVLLCALWYTTSALSSNTGKSIMTLFRYPVTLTFVQFGFVAGYCLLFMSPLVRFSRLRYPNKAIIQSTFPMGVFQVGGHIFSSMAISRIPVSTVHTIKALSPLFTVAAYALLFGVSYSPKTYVSLLPLTLGVMLVCTSDMSVSNAIGLLCAFGSAIVFVSQNIFFKKIVPSGPSAQSSHKLDKLNLLFYSSSMAFLLMIPIWLYHDLPALLSAQVDPAHVAHPTHGHATPHSVTYYFIANGTVHFAQNIIAFVILASTSPVTYSIASLIKRVAVICIAIVWFAQPVHGLQAVGITMTFVGLYMYNNAKGDVEKGEHKMRRVEAARDLALPTTKAELESDTEVSPGDVRADAIAPEPLAAMPEYSMGSAYGRLANAHAHPPPAVPAAPPSRHAPPPPLSYSRTHPNSNLHITITPPSATKATYATSSPVDSYPSPPPSLDSPPSSAVQPGAPAQTAPWKLQRRPSMVAGHPPPHQRPEIGTRRASVMA
ncbi:TPT-domain-containing protein [Trametes versicolor FP-101664 SS1]|uniref:TPT-domain-containing protein n=1 Tax=Trametes versicolor (strain FP-101664) TaxID=717944 RepID=UPI00046230F2|nr:TPT-domain-containing protein [Trametes versicolor FP-101664 SS1]EIW59787.1 TPT-domain-containing protein [Trametes versicolor FP-101664 SS1]